MCLYSSLLLIHSETPFKEIKLSFLCDKLTPKDLTASVVDRNKEKEKMRSSNKVVILSQQIRTLMWETVVIIVVFAILRISISRWVCPLLTVSLQVVFSKITWSKESSGSHVSDTNDLPFSFWLSFRKQTDGRESVFFLLYPVNLMTWQEETLICITVFVE